MYAVNPLNGILEQSAGNRIINHKMMLEWEKKVLNNHLLKKGSMIELSMLDSTWRVKEIALKNNNNVKEVVLQRSALVLYGIAWTNYVCTIKGNAYNSVCYFGATEWYDFSQAHLEEQDSSICTYTGIAGGVKLLNTLMHKCRKTSKYQKTQEDFEDE